MRQESLLFGAMAFRLPDYLDIWKRVPADSDIDEVIRGYFIRKPVLWF
jgi:hypothetical protein